ncbi:MAG: thiosulfate oxidation carrier protein SoxY [Gammaproteobacteria bacterium]|jgi:sulfur-oxidizing protein SoxY|nr:thiosulfate oxidation carrier protein SoxY [Gammaproteobacteria bacterium]
MDRRSILKAAGTISAAAAAVAAFPRAVFAAYSEKAFKNPKIEDSLNELFGGNATTPSGDVKLKAPDIAENGAVVPIEVSTSMKADKIAFMVKENPNPLAIVADIPAGTEAMVKTRVRMGKTTQVTAIVSSNGKLYTASKEVKVTIGGCGG